MQYRFFQIATLTIANATNLSILSKLSIRKTCYCNKNEYHSILISYPSSHLDTQTQNIACSSRAPYCKIWICSSIYYSSTITKCFILMFRWMVCKGCSLNFNVLFFLSRGFILYEVYFVFLCNTIYKKKTCINLKIDFQHVHKSRNHNVSIAHV